MVALTLEIGPNLGYVIHLVFQGLLYAAIAAAIAVVALFFVAMSQ